MKPSQVLEAARRSLLEPQVWCQSAFQKGDRRTAMTAIMLVEGPGIWEATNYFRRVAGCELITIWNDHPDRTHEEVIAAFSAAVALAESEGK